MTCDPALFARDQLTLHIVSIGINKDFDGLFEFGRDQFWPTSDSFTVTVDAKGQVTSVSELKEDAF